MALFESELRKALFESFPMIPFAAKKQAKQFFDIVPLFVKDADRAWIDSTSERVLNAFVLFYMQKHLEGHSISNLDILRNDTLAVSLRIKAFLDNNSALVPASIAVEVQVTETSKSSEQHECEHSRKSVMPEETKKLRMEPALKKSLMVVLVGLPGAGKSTFGEAFKRKVDSSSGMVVARLCQDEIGKSGCEREAHAKLQDGGYVVLIDRTNINPEQRKIWVDIAERYKVKVCALVFDVDEKICLERAKNRVGHTVSGGKAHMVVRTMAKSYKPVGKDEGMDEILTARSTDEAVGLLLGYIRKSVET